MVPDEVDSRNERERGRVARKRLPRSALGTWTVVDRDPTGFLVAACAGLVETLLPIRWKRMSTSPFAFFRGTAALMASDLAPRQHSGIESQICGDAHVLNVGAFGTPEGHLVFDINDFDETTRGPFEWDLLRFAAGMRLAGEQAARGRRKIDDAILTFARSYGRAMDRFASLPFIDVMSGEVKRVVTERPIHRILRRARRDDRRNALAKYARSTRAGWRLKRQRPVTFDVPEPESAAVIEAVDRYKATLTPERRLAVSHYRPIDVCFRVVGTGSVGTRDYVVLCQGTLADDVLLLQVKEARPSAYEPYVGRQCEPDGRRVVEGYRLMQRVSDPFLGWTDIDARSFIVRQLSDHKASLEAADVGGGALAEYADVVGEIFARAHARTGERAVIAGYVGRGAALGDALVDFAARYAAQTRRDYERFREAIRSGRLRARAES